MQRYAYIPGGFEKESYSKKKIMIQKYKIEGMTCGGCVAKVKTALEKITGIEEANY